ncbi:transporter substrate-binding domain-containing protein [Pseudoalteromonas rhizosphaerae]|uniref:Transporter substrate-binding domain-containing protein n=1 Tax=Pseudoalteromonas rhizosphaerae TaxID=2518973 RepID=A0ABW8KXC4_9GAMM
MNRYFAILFLFFPNHSFADTFRVALPDENYPPYHIIGGAKKGLLNELITQFAEQHSLTIEYTYVPEMRSEKMVCNGEVDARMESESWLSTAHKYYWSQEIVMVEDVMVVTHGANPSDFQDEKVLHNGVLLGRFGYVYPEYEPLVRDQILHRENFYSDLDVLQSLYNDNHISRRFTIMSRAVFDWYVNKYPKFSALGVSAFNVGEAPLQLQFAHTERGKKRAKEFNDFLQSLKDNGDLAKIIARYQ